MARNAWEVGSWKSWSCVIVSSGVLWNLQWNTKKPFWFHNNFHCAFNSIYFFMVCLEHGLNWFWSLYHKNNHDFNFRLFNKCFYLGHQVALWWTANTFALDFNASNNEYNNALSRLLNSTCKLGTYSTCCSIISNWLCNFSVTSGKSKKKSWF